MTTYNTGNPIGSTDPKDLYDNSENLDKAVNDTAALTWTDRRGVERKTMHAVEQSAPQAQAAAAEATTQAASAAESASISQAAAQVATAQGNPCVDLSESNTPTTFLCFWSSPYSEIFLF